MCLGQQVVQPLLQHPQYLLVRYAEVGASQARVGGARVRYRRVATPPSHWSGFHRHATEVAATRGGVVFVDQVNAHK